MVMVYYVSLSSYCAECMKFVYMFTDVVANLVKVSQFQFFYLILK